MNRDKFFFKNIVLDYFDLKILPLKTHKILFECYKDDSSSLRTIKYWYSRFNDRDFSLIDKPRAGSLKKYLIKKSLKK